MSEWYLPDTLLSPQRWTREEREFRAWLNEYGLYGSHADNVKPGHHDLAPGGWIPVVSFLYSRPRNLPCLDDLEGH